MVNVVRVIKCCSELRKVAKENGVHEFDDAVVWADLGPNQVSTLPDQEKKMVRFLCKVLGL